MTTLDLNSKTSMSNEHDPSLCPEKLLCHVGIAPGSPDSKSTPMSCAVTGSVRRFGTLNDTSSACACNPRSYAQHTYPSDLRPVHISRHCINSQRLHPTARPGIP